MDYVSERITNISDLEELIAQCRVLASRIEKEASGNEELKEVAALLSERLKQASDFEFCIERRRTTFNEEPNTGEAIHTENERGGV